MDVEQYRARLFNALDIIFEAVSKTIHVTKILDSDWYQRIQSEIAAAIFNPQLGFVCEPALMFFELDHWLRGDPTFEKGQDLLFQGKFAEASDEQKKAVGLFGLDPLRTILPLMEERLAAFSAFPFKKKEIQGKLKQLRDQRFSMNFRNYMFEVLVLGFFATEGVLTDIEIPVGSGGSTVDATLDLDRRLIYTEITYTSEELFKRPTQMIESGTRSFQLPVEQVVRKINAKVNNEKQLSLVDHAPTILIVGRNFRGADAVATKRAIQVGFRNGRFRKPSGFISSANWHFTGIEFFNLANATIPLNEKENQILNTWAQTKLRSKM